MFKSCSSQVRPCSWVSAHCLCSPLPVCPYNILDSVSLVHVSVNFSLSRNGVWTCCFFLYSPMLLKLLYAASLAICTLNNSQLSLSYSALYRKRWWLWQSVCPFGCCCRGSLLFLWLWVLGLLQTSSGTCLFKMREDHNTLRVHLGPVTAVVVTVRYHKGCSG